MTRSLYLSMLLAFLVFGCNSTNKKPEIETDTTSNATALNFPDQLSVFQCSEQGLFEAKETRLLYYFDGDCALCFGKLRALENLAATELGGIKPIFITRTSSLEMFSWNLKNSKITSCVWIDNEGEFEKANPDETYLEQMALIDASNKILTQGNLISDEEVLADFKGLLN